MNLSFIIPVFNSEKTLSKCIQSIQDQINDNDEIIVVDNGSKDNSSKIIEDYRIEKFFVKKNCNVSSVRNFGAEKAEGDIFVFIDSDCFLQINYVKNAKTIMQDETIHASGCKVDIPENANWIEKAWFSQRIKGEHEANYINSGNFLIRRKVFENVGGFNDLLITDEDVELCLRLKKLGYKILSSDKLSVIHYGNPKTIRAFFDRELWHSTGMIGSFKVKFFDKPLIATVLFMLLHLIGFSIILTPKFCIGLIMMTIIPALASSFRCIQSKNSIYFFPLFILYYIYFIARSLRIFFLIKNFVKRQLP